MGKKVITEVVITLGRDDLSGLLNNVAPNATWDVIDKLGAKVREKGAVRTGKRFTLFISNEGMSYVNKMY